MGEHKYKLYWEDIGERLIYAELDDLAMKLPEKVFGYKKENSFYIYRQGKLAAFFSDADIEKEARLGYLFFQKPASIRRVIVYKKKAIFAAKNYLKQVDIHNLSKLNNEQLRKLLLRTLLVWHKTLAVHFLSQPSFFYEFEKYGVSSSQQNILKQVARYRFNTRVAYSSVWDVCRLIFREYAKRLNIHPEEAENLEIHELENNTIPAKSVLARRAQGFVLISKNHNFKVYTGKTVKVYSEKYEDYSEVTSITSIKGIVGNPGKITGVAFVLKNENLNLKNLPKGMEKGMILIVQNAWPEISAYFPLASAIVTNEGGITSHGVVVAREFEIPCIVGTRIATKIFKTGDLVEVDADKGIVKILKKK